MNLKQACSTASGLVFAEMLTHMGGGGDINP